MDGFMGKAGEAMEAAKQKAGLAEEKKAPPPAADAGMVEGAKKKVGETAQYAQDRATDAAQWTKDSAVAGRDTAGSVFQQASGQVIGAKDAVVSSAIGAKDAVVSTLGMGGDTKPKAGKDTAIGDKDAVVSKLGMGGETKAEAGKDTATGGFLQQAGGQVMGAKDAVVNALGFGGDGKADAGGITKDTTS